MENDLERKVHDLDQRLRRLEQELSDERAARRHEQRRAAWIRIGIMIVVGGAYAWYLVTVTSIL